MIWENGIETCIISYMKRIASLGSMHDTGCLGLVHWDNPEGWYGEGGGKGVQDAEHVYTCGRFMLMYGSCVLLNYFFMPAGPLPSKHPLSAFLTRLIFLTFFCKAPSLFTIPELTFLEPEVKQSRGNTSCSVFFRSEPQKAIIIETIKLKKMNSNRKEFIVGSTCNNI